jgi:hypothetical protein
MVCCENSIYHYWLLTGPFNFCTGYIDNKRKESGYWWPGDWRIILYVGAL